MILQKNMIVFYSRRAAVTASATPHTRPGCFAKPVSSTAAPHTRHRAARAPGRATFHSVRPKSSAASPAQATEGQRHHLHLLFLTEMAVQKHKRSSSCASLSEPGATTAALPLGPQHRPDQPPHQRSSQNHHCNQAEAPQPSLPHKLSPRGRF